MWQTGPGELDTAFHIHPVETHSYRTTRAKKNLFGAAGIGDTIGVTEADQISIRRTLILGRQDVLVLVRARLFLSKQ